MASDRRVCAWHAALARKVSSRRGNTCEVYNLCLAEQAFWSSMGYSSVRDTCLGHRRAYAAAWSGSHLLLTTQNAPGTGSAGLILSRTPLFKSLLEGMLHVQTGGQSNDSLQALLSLQLQAAPPPQNSYQCTDSAGNGFRLAESNGSNSCHKRVLLSGADVDPTWQQQHKRQCVSAPHDEYERSQFHSSTTAFRSTSDESAAAFTLSALHHQPLDRDAALQESADPCAARANAQALRSDSIATTDADEGPSDIGEEDEADGPSIFDADVSDAASYKREEDRSAVRAHSARSTAAMPHYEL